MDGFSRLLFNVISDQFVRQIPRADGQVSPRPQMSPPARLPQMRKLLKQHPRADSFQPLHQHAHIHMRPVGHQHVNVVARHFPRQNRELVFHRNLTEPVAHPKDHLPHQDLLPIFRNPYQMHLEIVLRVRSQLLPFHATTSHDPILRLQGEGFPPSPRETLIDPAFGHAANPVPRPIDGLKTKVAHRVAKKDHPFNPPFLQPTQAKFALFLHHLN